MACSELTVTSSITKYGCISGTCQQSATGTFNEPTCAGTCSTTPPPTSGSSLLIPAAIGLGLAYILFGRSKKGR